MKRWPCKTHNMSRNECIPFPTVLPAVTVTRQSPCFQPRSSRSLVVWLVVWLVHGLNNQSPITINQPTNQPSNQTTNQPTNQPTNPTTNQPTFVANHHEMNERVGTDRHFVRLSHRYGDYLWWGAPRLVERSEAVRAFCNGQTKSSSSSERKWQMLARPNHAPFCHRLSFKGSSSTAWPSATDFLKPART